MSVGLLALIDDVAAFTKMAAASLDDVASQAVKATAKASGAVIDDAAVTPNFVRGFAAERELPIVLKIAKGSLRNKLLILLPAALALSLLLPGAITPLLMLGGAYLCYEGAEKVYGYIAPHQAAAHEAEIGLAEGSPEALEARRVSGAIKTDFILSAEIMTIVLSTVPGFPFWQQALILAFAAVLITLAVYGTVALLVKADDIGLALATGGRTGFGRAIGRGLVAGVPGFMQFLTVLGTAAMIWVGGGIFVHGLAELGLPQLDHAIEAASHATGGLVAGIAGIIETVVVLVADAIFGLLLGLLLIPVVGVVLVPAWKALRPLLPRRARA